MRTSMFYKITLHKECLLNLFIAKEPNMLFPDTISLHFLADNWGEFEKIVNKQIHVKSCLCTLKKVSTDIAENVILKISSLRSNRNNKKDVHCEGTKLLLMCVPDSGSYLNIHQSLPVPEQKLIINRQHYLHNKTCYLHMWWKDCRWPKYLGQKWKVALNFSFLQTTSH